MLALAVGALMTSRKTPLSPDELQLLNRSVEITAPIKPELRKDPVADSILLYRVTRVFEPSFDQLQPGRAYGTALLSWLPTLYRLPFLVFGLWLGGALWWVSRRLFNNEGGYVALALFCFSPLVILASSRINAEIIAAWGLFGIVYTAIGVGHTLYSPPRRWPPRILLLGLAFGFTAAAHLGAALLGAGLAIFFLLYLSPSDRTLAALAVFATAWLVAFIFLLGCYGWDSSFSGLLTYAGETLRPSMPRVGSFASWLEPINLPTIALLLVALAVFAGWKRTRYFGNWTPLLVIVLIVLLQFPGTAPVIWIAPFVYVFAGGIAADLLESRYRRSTQVVLASFIGLQALLSFPLHW
ncbi:MAG: hypothetical protein DMG67_19260 [Acidobacteria bacterium]|nr:MAG: hypothetical protein DMG67_19260 [Acidobacteriota bacterium]